MMLLFALFAAPKKLPLRLLAALANDCCGGGAVDKFDAAGELCVSLAALLVLALLFIVSYRPEGPVEDDATICIVVRMSMSTVSTVWPVPPSSVTLFRLITSLAGVS
uniref:Uncharacterized protein n=1 Tax=Anopheles melas TaxID=34690 RepID=A0A182UJ89_9DIPT